MNIYFCFIDNVKAIDCVDHNKLQKILKTMQMPDHLTCILWNLYTGQETTGSPDMEQRLVKRGERSTSMLYIETCLFSLYTEHIMQNAGLYELQAEIKIARRNINNIRYADDGMLTSWCRWKKRVKNLAWNSTLKKTKIMASSPMTWHDFMSNRRGKRGSSDRFYFHELPDRCGWWLQPWD